MNEKMYNNIYTKLDFQIFIDMKKYYNIGYSRYVMVGTLKIYICVCIVYIFLIVKILHTCIIMH